MTIVKQARRFDLGELRKAERTPQGFLKVPGFATRVGVFPYLDGEGKLRSELRHPDDVFDPVSLATLKYAPVTLEHPPVMLDPSNIGEYSKGHTTERVEVNREMVDVDLIIEHKDAIDAVESEGVRELSSGYLADIIEESGTYNGAPYNFRQKNIKYNHLAMVKRGRAGPEVRMRLDSADAVMRNDEIPEPKANEFGSESSINDADNSKKIVISGKEIELPTDCADMIQDMLDRYDEMRAKLADLEESVKAKRSDSVDITQKGVSPQIKVEQQTPDGRGAPGKVAAKPGSLTGHNDDEEKEDGDEHEEVGGATKMGKADVEKEDEESEDKKDYEAGNAASGGGAAMSPVDQMKKDLDETKAKLDAMMAKHDEMAASSMNMPEKKPDRMDSKGIQLQIRSRVKLERQAEKLVPFEVAKKFDSMSDSEIRETVIKHKHPKADLEGKSDVYLQSRFDSIMEANEELSSESRALAGKKLLGADRMDASLKPGDARLKMVQDSRDLWKSDLAAKRKN